MALVTGAARPRGIGRATALTLAAGGADVACLDIARPYAEAPPTAPPAADDLARLAEEIEPLGGRVPPPSADVSDEEAVEAAVAAVSDELGTVTLVANVAGGQRPGLRLRARCSACPPPSSAACSM